MTDIPHCPRGLAANRRSPLKDRARFIIGGFGGLAPIVIFVVNGKFPSYFNGSFALVTLGFLVRAVGMFLIGGFVVTLYPEVKQRIKIFQLGLSAPAMLAGIMAASSNSSTLVPTQDVPGLALIPVVYAQANSLPADVKQFTLPPPSALGQFVRGLIDYQAKPSNVWFVIAGSFSTVDNARADAKQLNDKFRGFHADVYAPFSGNPNYDVVIGAQLTQQDAKALRDKAVAAGFNSQTYYRTFPNLPLPSK